MTKNKKAAIEMSMGTIIVLVLGVSMLILGMVLIRNIMCSGLQITEELTTGVKNEIKNLFGADKIGVKCMGEGGQDIKIGTGGKRKIICIIKENQADVEYTLTTTVSVLPKTSKLDVQPWILSNGGDKVAVRPGDETEYLALYLNIPEDAPSTDLSLSIDVLKTINGVSPSRKTITSTISVVPTGAIRGAIC